MDLSKVKDLTDEQKTLITEEHDSDLSALNKKLSDLQADLTKLDSVKAEQENKNKKDQEKVDADKVKNANSLDELKKLLLEERGLRVELEKNILKGEEERVKIKDNQTVESFVNKFIGENVVDDSLVRDAIKNKISDRLGVRDGKVVELSGSELTGKTGEQILAEIRVDKGYSNHLVASRGNGGGATGSVDVVDVDITKMITREQFESTSHGDIAAFIRTGGKVVD